RVPNLCFFSRLAVYLTSSEESFFYCDNEFLWWVCNRVRMQQTSFAFFPAVVLEAITLHILRMNNMLFSWLSSCLKICVEIPCIFPRSRFCADVYTGEIF
ncbi:hypothetical protein KC19_12G173400, partial [Ceratodon purpureus]